MEKSGLYKTSNLYIAAWLLSKGLKLQDIDHHNRQRCDFASQDTKLQTKSKRKNKIRVIPLTGS